MNILFRKLKFPEVGNRIKPEVQILTGFDKINNEIFFQSFSLAYATVHVNEPTVTEALLFVLQEKLEATYELVSEALENE